MLSMHRCSSSFWWLLLTFWESAHCSHVRWQHSHQRLKTEKSNHGHCAVLRPIYIFAGIVSGAINGGNFATVLRGASTVIRISVANWTSIVPHKARLYLATIGLEAHAATNCNFLRPKNKLEKPFQKRLR